MNKKSTLPLISVVMLNWNGLEDTKQCLKSLKKSTYPNFEIIIVDNGSVDGSKEWLRKQKDLVVVDLEKNYGVTGGHNKGYEASQGEFIANLNNDATVAPDWLWELYKPMERDKKIAVTGGKAYEWNDSNPVFNESNEYFTYQVVDLYGGYAHTMRTGLREASVNSISTVGALMRRSAIEKVGYFDNDFFAYYDETDQFARFKRAGYKVVYTPSAKLWHMIGNSTKDVPYFYLYHMHRNRFMFAVKNYDKKYLWPFLRIYTRDSLGGLYRKLRGSKDLNNKAQYRAYFWNIAHFWLSFKKRKDIMALGPTYNDLLPDETAEYVSVIITCYNYAEYVEEAINSVLNQTQNPLEIIVINDGSTDDSLGVIEKYKDKIKIIDKKNEGVVVAKNQGLIEAKGEWIIFLDADDVIKSDYIEKTLKFARQNNYDVVYTDMEYFGEINGVFKAKPYSFGQLLATNFVHNSSLYKKSKLHEAGGYKVAMKDGYEDWEINISIAKTNARFGYLQEPLLKYRQHHIAKGRNNQAAKKAHELMATVRKLHRSSYYSPSYVWFKTKRFRTRLFQYPLLPLVVCKSFVAGIIKSKGSIKRFFIEWRHGIRYYIHKKDEEHRISNSDFTA